MILLLLSLEEKSHGLPVTATVARPDGQREREINRYLTPIIDKTNFTFTKISQPIPCGILLYRCRL